MESAFFGTRRAGGLLQQFRRLSFCCGPCTLITRTSFTKIRGPHAVPVPTLRPCLSRTAFPFALVGAPVAWQQSSGGTLSGKYRLWWWVCSYRGTIAAR